MQNMHWLLKVRDSGKRGGIPGNADGTEGAELESGSPKHTETGKMAFSETPG